MSGRGAAGHYRTGWSCQRVARDIELHDIEHGWSDRQLASIIYRALRRDDEVVRWMDRYAITLDDLWAIIRRGRR